MIPLFLTFINILLAFIVIITLFFLIRKIRLNLKIREIIPSSALTEFMIGQNIKAVNQRFDIKEITNISSNNKKIGIVKPCNNSLHCVIDIQPILFTHLPALTGQNLEQRLYNGLSEISFGFKIIKRIVNNNIFNKFNLLLNKVEHQLKNNKDFKSFERFNNIKDNLLKIAHSHNAPLKKYYAVIYTEKGDITLLLSRLRLYQKMLADLGLKNFKVMDSNQLYNLYLSYLQDCIYYNDTYYTVEMLVKHGLERYEDEN